MRTAIITTSVLLSLGVTAVSAQSRLQLSQNLPTVSQTKQDNRLDRLVTLPEKSYTLEEAIREIAKQADIYTYFSPQNPDLKRTVRIEFNKVKALDALNRLLQGTQTKLTVTPTKDGVVLRGRGENADSATRSSDSIATGSITGTVLDSATGSGIAGVSVRIGNADLSVTDALTDASGVFRIPSAPAGAVALVFRSLGRGSVSRTMNITANQSHQITVYMPPSVTALSEIVTTATGEQRRIEIPNDIARIIPEQVMQRTPVRNMTDLLEAAQIPGVLVSRSSGDPGANTSIRIRGIGSISQNNDPVVIVDGIWLDASGGAASRLDDIDPSTIETVEIVRGPSASTLYGQDASNGVIVITTKKGVAGRTRWNLTYDHDWGSVRNKRAPVYVGWGMAMNEERVVPCSIDRVLATECLQDSVSVYDPNHRLLGTEGHASTDRYVLSVDGGVSAITYSITGTIQNQLGAARPRPIDLIRMRLIGYQPDGKALKPTHLARRSIASNFVMNPRENLSFALNLAGNYSNNQQNRVQGSFRVPEIGSSAATNLSLDTTQFLLSPLTSVSYNVTPKTSTGVVLGFQTNWRPVSSWRVSATTGLEKVVENGSLQLSRTHCPAAFQCFDTTGTRTESRTERDVYTVRLNASSSISNLGYMSRFLELRPAIGADYRQNRNSVLSLSMDEIPPGESSLIGGQYRNSVNTSYANATAGWYINTTVGLFQRVYFDVGVRQDIGSAITSSSNTAYPKLGTSWLISDENFWPVNNWVNLLRLRGALGHAAVQPDMADIHGSYVSDYVYTEGGYQRSIRLSRGGNPELAPERATEFELGFETDLIYDRVNLIFTYAQKENRNTLVNRQLAPSSGILTPRKENIARVRNSVFELSGTGRVVENRSVQLMLNYSMTMTENRVLRLGDGVMPFGLYTDSRIEAGYPIAGIWSRIVMGYRDVDGDMLISPEELVMSDSVSYLGWSQPRYRASYGASLSLGGQITLDTRFAYKSHYVLNVVPVSQRSLEDISTPLNEQAVARVSVLNGSRPASDLRWNSASITYQLPIAILNRIRARSLSVSLQGRDLAVWTNFLGRDPGVTGNVSAGSEATRYGNATPLPRLFTLSFRWGF